jgi:hypothetical protein
MNLPVNLDPKTMIVTAVLLPAVFVVVRRVRRIVVDNFSYALDYVVWIVGRNFHEAFAKRVSLKRYGRLKLADPASSYLPVPGPRNVTLDIDATFVPLHFETAGRQVPVTLVDAMNKDTRITVIGEPGSGKSSLVKQTFREECRASQWRARRVRLPIALELKDFIPPEDVIGEEEAGEWALERLRERVKVSQGFDMGRFFDSYVDGPGLLVLLDGLDEVASGDYGHTVSAIRGLSELLAVRSPTNIVVLTMRSQFHQQVKGEIERSFPSVYRIAPFTPGEIFHFLQLWPFAANADEHISRIYSDLTDRPTLREMCRNPLVLSMYVANDQGEEEETQATPDTRTTFYDQVVSELVVERRSRQLGTSARGKLRRDREEILGRLALDNLMDRDQAANSPGWGTALRIYGEVYRCSSKAEAEEGLLELEKDTGIISQEREGESLRFIHLTFCEFMAAKEAALGEEGGFDRLLARHEEFGASPEPQLRSRLNEVIPFSAALVPRFQRDLAIAQVAAGCGLEILGRCFLETQEYGNEVWQDYLDEVRAGLLRADPLDWTDEWIAQLHLFNVVLQDAELWAEIARQPVDINLEDVFAGLVRSDRERLVKLFSSYAVNDPAAALRLAETCGVDLGTEYPALVVANCDSPPFLAVALQKAEGWSDGSQRWTALLAEAALRQRVVALLLHGRDAPREFARRLGRVDRKERWSGLPGVFIIAPDARRPAAGDPDRSAYTAILTLASRLEVALRDDLPALGVIAAVPAPTSTVSSWSIRLISLLGASAVAVALHFALFGRYGGNVVAALGAGATLIAFWRYPSSRRRRYAALANLPSPYLLIDVPTGHESLIETASVRRRRRGRVARRLRAGIDRVYFRKLNAGIRRMGAIRSNSRGRLSRTRTAERTESGGAAGKDVAE